MGHHDVYSFIRPIAQGRSELLYGCAGVTFLIPLVDLWVNYSQLFAGFITLKQHFSGIWPHCSMRWRFGGWRNVRLRYVMDFSGNIARC